MDATIEMVIMLKDKKQPITIIYTCPYCCKGEEMIEVQIDPLMNDAVTEALENCEGIPLNCYICKKELTLIEKITPR